MSDVFISYARSTAAQADRMTDALRGLGYEVWRDDQLPAHLAYGEVIEERLHEARAVVVIWSVDALQSVWVRSEADRARSLKKLVQISVDGCRLPMPFDQIQCADLASWTGDADHKGFRKVVESVSQLVADRTATISSRRPADVAATVSAAEPRAAEPALEAREAAAPAPTAEPPPVEHPFEPQEHPAPVLAVEPPPAEPLSEPQEHPAAALAAEPPPAQCPSGTQGDVGPALAIEPSPGNAPAEAQEHAATPLAAQQAPAAAQPQVRAVILDGPGAVTAARRKAEPRLAMVGLGAVGAAVLIGAGVWFAAGGSAHHRARSTPTRTRLDKPTLALAMAPTLTGVADGQIARAATAAADDAREQGRPGSETAALTQLATQLDSLLAQLKSASARPGGAGTVAALTTQLNQTAAQGAQLEATTMSHAGDAMASEARNTLRGDGAPGATAAMAALRDSTQKLRAASASTSKAVDAAGSLAALHATFAAWAEVRADYATASALYPQVLRARFEASAGAASAAARRVVAAAGGPRPWLFASSNQKRAYAALQANAATAKTELGQLQALAQTVASSSRESQLRAAIRQADAIRSSLDALASPPSSSASAG